MVSYKAIKSKIFTNYKSGSTDDTDAINSAITAGSRCGQGCDSSTTTPALVYCKSTFFYLIAFFTNSRIVPPGTYSISKPLIQLYYTQFVGDAVSVPTIKATAGFSGIALIDSDPYDNSGK